MKAFVLGLSVLAFAGAAQASPCSEKIAALQSRYETAKAAGVVTPGPDATAPETTSAKLHRQPTVGSVAHAEAKADTEADQREAHFQIKMDEARAAENSGDARTCEAAVAEAEKSLTP
jgi:hypothetical protein